MSDAIEVFFCMSSEGRDPPQWLVEMRHQMADLCAMRWRREPCKMRYTVPLNVRKAGFREPFQKARRRYADETAEGDLYVVVDDDILLGSMPIIEPMREIMEREPTIGILALNLGQTINAGAYMTKEVVQSHAVGGMRMCRKGIIKDWPEMLPSNPYQYDVLHGKAVEDAGYISAYTAPGTLTGMHLGSGYSLTWSGERHQPQAQKPQAILRVT